MALYGGRLLSCRAPSNTKLKFRMQLYVYGVKRKKEEIRVSPMTKKTLHQQKKKTKNIVTTHKHEQNLRLHNDCGPT